MPVEMKSKVCLIGDPGVGKTSLVSRFVLNAFSEKYLSTVGTVVSKKTILIKYPKTGMVDHTFLIWDIVGQQRLQKLHRMYYRGAKGAILVCDVTRKETLEHLPHWLELLASVEENLPTILLVNKTDMMDEWAISTEDIDEFKNKLNFTSYMTSAKTGKNVEEAFLHLGKIIYENEEECNER